MDVELNMNMDGAGNRDFSNPMYDAIGNMPMDVDMTGKELKQPANDADQTNNVSSPPTAIITPSSVIQKASPQIQVKHRELDPSSIDTGKDTQRLVMDDDDGSIEC